MAVGEAGLIARIRTASRARNGAVRLGIGDDCAVLRVARGHEMVVTTDFSLEGRHFRRDWHSPQSVGHRSLLRGVSDVAAMGGKPFAAFLSLALPKGFAVEWVDGFLEGFDALAEHCGVELAGGDTAEAAGSEIVADVMVVGCVRKGRELVRTGAQAGDCVYVTGGLGGAAAELAGLAAGRPGAVRAGPGLPGTFPEPRVQVGLALMRRRLATSCMDLSDGLSTDLRRLCEASGVGAEIEAEAIPAGTGATLEQALHGGEDYELLFTAREWTRVPPRLAGVRVRSIGRITEGSGVRIKGADGVVTELPSGGWEHFGDSGANG